MIYLPSAKEEAVAWQKSMRAIRARARLYGRLKRPRKMKIEGITAELEEAFVEQAILNQALLKLLLKKKRFTQKAFEALLTEVDLLDGVQDGQLHRREEGGSRSKKGGADRPAPKSRKGKRARIVARKKKR
ncbi:MAG: hypothetical protein ACYTHM_00080 [Planctomycetota bacterium]|jgi:hypothetical protein